MHGGAPVSAWIERHFGVIMLAVCLAAILGVIVGTCAREPVRARSCERTCRSLYAMMIESTPLGCTCESRDDGRRFLICEEGENVQRTVLTVPPPARSR
jgi:hypothetical protein